MQYLGHIHAKKLFVVYLFSGIQIYLGVLYFTWSFYTQGKHLLPVPLEAYYALSERRLLKPNTSYFLGTRLGSLDCD